MARTRHYNFKSFKFRVNKENYFLGIVRGFVGFINSFAAGKWSQLVKLHAYLESLQSARFDI